MSQATFENNVLLFEFLSTRMIAAALYNCPLWAPLSALGKFSYDEGSPIWRCDVLTVPYIVKLAYRGPFALADLLRLSFSTDRVFE